ncbi:hypothetical protein Pmani_029923 [Petrolisthes manimaculis]|uniref:Rho-GAP domain-containing protein n=1 Tax=Petrolisthes manimaculis TaxID=1843537 RepID=A0AAE1NX44_9EUCA|nr:hypothetical protein Pmani_029923 [Petrolisthes manimaculis]
MYAHPSGPPGSQEETSLDEDGLKFTSRAISMLESRGLEDQGLYRLVGVSSKVNPSTPTRPRPTESREVNAGRYSRMGSENHYFSH